MVSNDNRDKLNTLFRCNYETSWIESASKSTLPILVNLQVNWWKSFAEWHIVRVNWTAIVWLDRCARHHLISPRALFWFFIRCHPHIGWLNGTLGIRTEVVDKFQEKPVIIGVFRTTTKKRRSGSQRFKRKGGGRSRFHLADGRRTETSVNLLSVSLLPLFILFPSNRWRSPN